MKTGNFLSKEWKDFEAWIKAKVGSEISWKKRPKDTKVNRMIVAMSILKTLEQNGGKFPPSGNAFIELKRRDKEYSLPTAGKEGVTGLDHAPRL